jgi:tRNA dimethylallyltransferase
MDIGTNKPSLKEMERIKHYLVDIITPGEKFNAKAYQLYAKKAIDEIFSQNKNVIVIGGTGLYIKVLTKGIFSIPKIPDEIRKSLKEEAERIDSEILFQKLVEVDPIIAEKLHPNDKLRILRALEVYKATGTPYSSYIKKHNFNEENYKSLKIGLNMSKEELYKKLEDRTLKMLKSGWIEEVKSLLEMGFQRTDPGLEALGYKHIISYLKGEIKREDMERLIKRDTKRYAKRQFTWFKADSEIIWYNYPYKEILFRVKNFLSEN